MSGEWISWLMNIFSTPSGEIAVFCIFNAYLIDIDCIYRVFVMNDWWRLSLYICCKWDMIMRVIVGGKDRFGRLWKWVCCVCVEFSLPWKIGDQKNPTCIPMLIFFLMQWILNHLPLSAPISLALVNFPSSFSFDYFRWDSLQSHLFVIYCI